MIAWMLEFMIGLYHNLAEDDGSSAKAADKQNECQCVENVLLVHVVLRCVDGFIIAQILPVAPIPQKFL